MNLAYVDQGMRAQERVDFHDLAAEMPELARDALLAAAQGFFVGLVGIIEFLPEPAPCAAEDPRGMRPHSAARKDITGPITVLCHTDGNIDASPAKRSRQCVRDIGMKADCL